jgi:hypothetical protein
MRPCSEVAMPVDEVLVWRGVGRRLAEPGLVDAVDGNELWV